jgi:two-component system, OmpR family, response regulator
MAKILIVEDDRDLGGMVLDWLRFEHHNVEMVHNGQEGLERLQTSEYDCVVLDWELPGMDGIEVCRRFRSGGGHTPIIMLTGKNAISEKEAGLDSGADDYLTKPFNMKELSARLRALLRRPVGVVSNILKVRDIEMDPARYLVTKAGVEIQLLPKEFSLLEFFMRHPNQVFSSDALIQRVWHSDSDATGDAIRTCLKRLRKKLGDNDEKEPIIQTVHGVGYRMRG